MRRFIVPLAAIVAMGFGGATSLAARVRHFLYRTPEEFYDYENDPDALVNLIDDARQTDQINALRVLLRDHLCETNDPQFEAFQTRVLAK